mgnify:CR=1 FL=1
MNPSCKPFCMNIFKKINFNQDILLIDYVFTKNHNL